MAVPRPGGRNRHGQERPYRAQDRCHLGLHRRQGRALRAGGARRAGRRSALLHGDRPDLVAEVGGYWAAELATSSTISDAVQPGDILLVRLGWVRALLDASGPAADTLFRPRTYSGLSGGEDMWQFLWDHRIAAVAANSVTVEVWPIQDDSLHLAIARLGLTIGEMFDFEALAEDCAATATIALS